jgi:membrane-associated phospholipid phosphatase
MNRIIALLVVAVAVACNDGRPVGPDSPALAASRAGVPFTERLVSPEWQATAASLAAQARISPPAGARALSLLGVAQYLAVQEAEATAGGTDANSEATGIGLGTGGRRRLETDRGAVAGASAVVLTYLFPSQAQALEDLVSAHADAGPGQRHPAFAAAEAIGRAVGAEIVARAQGDGFNNAFTPTIPTGPGYWISNTIPPSVVGGTLPGTRPWFLNSADQFRSPPPPAIGSAAFQADLAEIRQISDTRTAEQAQIAIFWVPNRWLPFATDRINEHQLSEREATHLYALLNATIFDALIACWDTKQTFWFIRPWQADVGITVVPEVGKPNHPAYPSGHSCSSASAAEVLKTFFPERGAQLDAMVTAAGLARMYAGIHYQFDIDAGRAIGRSVAAFAIARDASGNSVLTPR